VSILFFLLPLALLFALGFLAAFAWATRQGQFDDLDTPKYRILMDDPLEHQNRQGD
jgi:cbb3-type cytochrome oxidase maturation protein